MEIIPRPAQNQAIKPALNALKSARRALVVMATGLGKTLTSALITKELRPEKILFLAHNNFIIEHAIGEFRQVFTKRELSVALYNGMSKNGAREADMVFATWQTMGKNLKKWGRKHFDLVIVDEAHHEGAETYRPVVQYFTAPKLGITATYERSDDINICDTFGEPVTNITLEEAIARGWLPRIEYHVITDKSLNEETLRVIVQEIRSAKRRFTMAEVDRRLFIKKREEEIARVIDERPEKSIVFCRDIKHANSMAKMLSLSDTFHSGKGKGGKDSLKHNLAVLNSLRQGETQKVCAVNAFNEGVDVPSVELVVFCRATSSGIIFRQQLGRGLRQGKEKLVVLDFVGNLERIHLVEEIMNRIADLHEEFTSQDERTCEGYTREPFEVSGTGFEFTFSDEIVDLMEVLRHCERDFYPTWQEASEAAIALGITSVKKYNQCYKEDQHLPSDPSRTYLDFPDWKIFLETGKYLTWQEASKAAIALGICTQREYRQRYKEDCQFPCNPYKTYSDFPGWKVYLRTVKEKYLTWQEASEAAIALGTTSRRMYVQLCKKDEKLPGSPHEVYTDFPGWGVFLKTGREKRTECYSTWQEASEAAIALGIKTSTEYSPKYQEDALLPGSPDRAYLDFPGWRIFLGGIKKNLYSTWQEASEAAIALGIKNLPEYRRRYKEDPKLPSEPENRYKEDFPGATVFFGGVPKGVPYPTWQEASKAAIAMGAVSKESYSQVYKKDPRLISNPPRYPNFPGWKVFLGKK